MTGRNINIYLQENIYKQVRKIAGNRQISRYISEALVEKLKFEKQEQQTELQQRLIRGYQAMSKNKKLQKDLAVWEETLGDSYR